MLNYYIKIRMRNDVGHMEIKPLRGTTFIHVYHQDLKTQLQSKMVDLSCCVQNQIVNFPMFFFSSANAYTFRYPLIYTFRT